MSAPDQQLSTTSFTVVNVHERIRDLASPQQRTDFNVERERVPTLIWQT